jgi:WD40 repeat protein
MSPAANRLSQSPDGKTLLVLTAGYNNLDDSTGTLVAAASQQYVFVYDISGGTPAEKQVLTLPNTYVGIAFSPNGQSFYVGGGVNDNIHIFAIQTNGPVGKTLAVLTCGYNSDTLPNNQSVGSSVSITSMS